MPQAQTTNVNFQTDTKMKDDLYAMARRHERSASAEVRLAVRAWLARDQSPATAHRHASEAAKSP
jgi:hypothetical protein